MSGKLERFGCWLLLLVVGLFFILPQLLRQVQFRRSANYRSTVADLDHANDQIMKVYEENGFLLQPVENMNHSDEDGFSARLLYPHPQNDMADVFSRQETNFGYYVDGNKGLLYSAGPDKRYGTDPAMWFIEEMKDESSEIQIRSYDPSNGTISPGDIFRVVDPEGEGGES